MTSRADSLRHLEREVGVLIRRIKRVIGERARAVHEDLQPASYLMLAWIVEEGPIRASSMVEKFNIDKGAVSRQLHHLADLGLVERTPDPADGRASLVVASDDARRRLADVAEHRRKWLDQQLGDWTIDELETFAATLGKYNLSLNA
jgi:DNA-binding MarR family transcriptional regulator